jgi:2-polyprenyl-6-methoxyphenol hydroxylase-like FAD-dependent oxidoreductase
MVISMLRLYGGWMPDPIYDAIVVGARCAGSPTAMLLARAGHRVLLVDRATFPSDTLSTHFIHPTGVSYLQRWGLLQQLQATGCPPVSRYRLDFGPLSIDGSPHPSDGVRLAYAPRRTILDKVLIDAASRAGAEVREAFSVEELVVDNGAVCGVRGRDASGHSVVERARVVIGADGRHSAIAGAVEAEEYLSRSPLLIATYTYWSGLPTNTYNVFIRPQRGWGVLPTHDDLTLIVVGWPYREFETNRHDLEGHYRKSLKLAPEFAERVRAARREAPFVSTAVRNYFRQPFGPGWALVGDAGYNKDPITAQGISDAFRDAEHCAAAIHAWLGNEQPFDEAMTTYQRLRDTHSRSMYELTCTLATLEPPPLPMQQALAAAQGKQDAMDTFVSVIAGTLPPDAMFAPAGEDAVAGVRP